MARGLWALIAAGLLLSACGVSRPTPKPQPRAATAPALAQSALWWAIPTLLQSGVPVYLPTWLPPSGFQGPAPVAPVTSFALDPMAAEGFPPLTVSPRAEVPAAGRLLPVPGYTVGVGYAGQGAEPGPNVKPLPSFQPYLVPATLASPYTAAAGGRNTPPVYLGAIKITGRADLPGHLVSLGEGRRGYLATFSQQGNLGDWTRVAWEQGGFAYVVGYPAVQNGGEAIALRIARSLVRVSRPPSVSLTFRAISGNHPRRFTLRLLPGGPLTSRPPAPILLGGPPSQTGQAFGYRYVISRTP